MDWFVDYPYDETTEPFRPRPNFETTPSPDYGPTTAKRTPNYDQPTPRNPTPSHNESNLPHFIAAMTTAERYLALGASIFTLLALAGLIIVVVRFRKKLCNRCAKPVLAPYRRHSDAETPNDPSVLYRADGNGDGDSDVIMDNSARGTLRNRTPDRTTSN